MKATIRKVIPYDRRWPGLGANSAKPYIYGWYEYTPEVRFAAIMNSWIIINNAIDQSESFFGKEVTDDMLMVLAWGANDQEALDAGKVMLEEAGASDFYDGMVGEGRNDWNGPDADGWPRINGQDSGIISDTSYGRIQIDDILEVMDEGKGMWERWAQHPGEVALFEKALDGGNMTPSEQGWKHRGELGMEGTETIALTMVTAGYVLGPKIALYGPKAARILNTATQSTKFTRGVGKIRTGIFLTTMASYGASRALGVADSIENEAGAIVEAVESGQMSAYIAVQYLQMVEAVSGETLPESVVNADWFKEAVTETAPVEIEGDEPTAERTSSPAGSRSEVRAMNKEINTPVKMGDPGTVVNKKIVNPQTAPMPGVAGDAFTSVLDDQTDAIRQAEEDLAPNPAIAISKARGEARLAHRETTMGGMPWDIGVTPTVTPSRRETLTPYQKGVYFRGSEELLDTYRPRYYQDDYEDIHVVVVTRPYRMVPAASDRGRDAEP